MTPELFAGAVGFATVTTVTPGPNNVMVLTSGVHHGYRRTLPHLLGIAVGVTALTLLCGAGVGALLLASPVLLLVLRVVAAAYLLYLAWRIARGSMHDDGAVAPPVGFVRALLFQFANPKAWIVTLGAIAEFTRPATYLGDVAVVAAVLAIVSIPATSIWAAGGIPLRRLLARPRALRIFTVAMALLLVASVVPVVLESLQR